ncbi:MAG: hypothetical protein C0412_18120 [Flavobacterium sp.]|nr:hypothetical protein [Flavobacterium sp.]
MMNILHISPNFNYSCGVSKYIENIFKLFSSKNEFKLYFITNGGDSLDRLTELGVAVHIMNFTTGLGNIFNFRSNLIELHKYCRENKIDIIHSHHRYPEFLANKISQHSPIKTITTVHSIVYGFKNISYKSDRIIAVSKSVEASLIDNFDINPKKVTQLYNFLDPVKLGCKESQILLREKLLIPKGHKILLFAGRICYQKGVDVLLKSFGYFEKDSVVTLLFVGSVDEKMKRIFKNISSRNVKVIEPQKDLSDYYSLADIIVLPSREDSFPFVMLEAGLFSKPFIGSDVGGIKEFIDDGECGLLFKSEDPEDLFSKITTVFSDETLNVRLGSNLYKKVISLTLRDNYYNSLSSIYKDLQKNH